MVDPEAASGLDVPARQEVLSITSGIWRIGKHQRRPVLLARRIDLVLQQANAVARVHTTATPWVITPKPLRTVEGDPLTSVATWLPMEERFTLHGGNVCFGEPGAATHRGEPGSLELVHGPFSEDFRHGLLQGESEPIELSAAQAAVFKALWEFGGEPQQGHVVMTSAGLASDKPVDVFKVNAQHKGDARYERPLHAYKEFVEANRRAGTYSFRVI